MKKIFLMVLFLAAVSGCVIAPARGRGPVRPGPVVLRPAPAAVVVRPAPVVVRPAPAVVVIP